MSFLLNVRRNEGTPRGAHREPGGRVRPVSATGDVGPAVRDVLGMPPELGF